METSRPREPISTNRKGPLEVDVEDIRELPAYALCVLIKSSICCCATILDEQGHCSCER